MNLTELIAKITSANNLIELDTAYEASLGKK
jgi:hypothetical protein